MAICPECRAHYPDGVTTCEADGAALVPDDVIRTDPDLAAGDAAGEYRIEAVIGRGGFGTVYRAVHPVIGKSAAVKVLDRQYSANPDMVARFVSEARAVNRIGHKNIVDIFSFGVLSDGRNYYVMELLEGAPLDRYLEDRARLPPEEALLILRAVARALDAAHAAGIAHRDLKPANIFLTFDEDGRPYPKLLDFGIAKLFSSPAGAAGQPRTRTGTPMGTPLYMSPEQIRGESVTNRTDVYSFGVMAHEILTGRLPFSDASHVVVMMQHLTNAPPRMSEHCTALAAGLDEPVLQMLDKEAQRRPPTLGAAFRALALAAREAGHDVEVPAADASVARVSGGASSGHRAPSTGGKSAISGDAATLVDPSSGSQPASVASKSPGSTLGAQTLSTEAPKSRMLLVAFAAIAVFGGGVVVALVSGGEQSPAESLDAKSTLLSQPPASPPLTPTAPPSATAAASAPTNSATGLSPEVDVTIQSTPQAVEVFVGDRLVGTAPGPVRLPRGDAPVVLTFKAKGYAAQEVPFTPSRGGVVSVTLQKAAPSKKKAARKAVDELEF